MVLCLAAPQANPRLKAALPLLEHNHASAARQVVVLGIAAREAAVGQQDAMPHGGIVVVVVMTAEDTHHVA